MEKSAKSQKYIYLDKKNRYNTAFKLAIEEENKNAIQIHIQKKQDEDYYNLAIEKPCTKKLDGIIEDNMPFHNMYIS